MVLEGQVQHCQHILRLSVGSISGRASAPSSSFPDCRRPLVWGAGPGALLVSPVFPSASLLQTLLKQMPRARGASRQIPLPTSDVAAPKPPLSVNSGAPTDLA